MREFSKSVENPGVEFSVSAAFGDRARPVLDLIDDLRNIGVQKCVPIPQIAVMGDQSSGKSSVLEAISGIAFPRSSGLCTRCPTQVSMTQGDVWSATIRAGDGEEQTLKAGQEHLIAELIETLTVKLAGAKSEGGFSSDDDLIEIKLVSPNVPDLTIIDLPGIVRTTTRGQSEQVQLQVDAMLDRYLQQERTIVLAVIPANVDIATVDILERAAKVDPEGRRTIGVLTKPDLVDKGAEHEVIEVLANRAKPLLHGYFMVKNRSQNELDDDEPPEVARERERAWLANSKYANIAGVSDSRLGVRTLTTALTELLVHRIEVVLPDMKLEVEQNLKEANEELAKLGKPPPSGAPDCRAFAGDVIREFCRALRKTCSEASPIMGNGCQKSDGVLQQERRLRKEFKSAVDGSKPGFDGEFDTFVVEVTEAREPDLEQLPSTREFGSITFPIVPSGNIGLGSPSGNTGFGKSSGFQPVQSRRHGISAPKTIIGEVLTDQEWPQPRSITRVGDELSYSYEKNGFSKAKIVEVTNYFRGDLAKRIEERRGRELPGFMSFPVFTDLIAEYVERWNEPTKAFQSALCDVLKDKGTSLVPVIAKDWPRLADKLKDEFLAHLEETRASTSVRLSEQLALERMPSTENHYLWDTINKIRDERMLQKLKAGANSRMISVDVVCALLKSDIGSSSNEAQEVQDMIDILKAYWKLANKRYIDDVAMIVTDAYTGPRHMDAIESKLSSKLVHKLDDIGLKRLFEPDRMKEKQRVELEQRAKSMKKGLERLQEGI